MKARFLKYIAARLNEASTWRGIISVVTGFGVYINPDYIVPLVSLGLALGGMIGACFPEEINKND